ncbi:MAG: hypothetical protein V4576_02470 [Patescibacteria group bacterium]
MKRKILSKPVFAQKCIELFHKLKTSLKSSLGSVVILVSEDAPAKGKKDSRRISGMLVCVDKDRVGSYELYLNISKFYKFSMRQARKMYTTEDCNQYIEELIYVALLSVLREIHMREYYRNWNISNGSIVFYDFADFRQIFADILTTDIELPSNPDDEEMFKHDYWSFGFMISAMFDINPSLIENPKALIKMVTGNFDFLMERNAT